VPLARHFRRTRTASGRHFVPNRRSGGFSQRVHYFCQWPLWETQCRCHQPNQPGHGPNFRLTRKVHGKTVTETFASLSALRKAQREIEGFHRFRELSRELLDVNERICHARPVEATLTAQEKKRPQRFSERSRAK